MVETVYDSGRFSFLARLVMVNVAIALFVFSIVILISIPFPNIPVFNRAGSILACLAAACLPMFMAIIIGSGWRYAVRIQLIESTTLKVSRDWIFGTFYDSFDVSKIESFDYSAKLLKAGTTYQVWAIYREPQSAVSQGLPKWFDFIGRTASILGLPTNQIEELISFKSESFAADLTQRLNDCTATLRGD